MAAAIDHYLVKNPDFDAPISLVRDRINTVSQSDLAWADVLHVHWTNGLVAPSALAELARGKKVVWTLHDMNPLTGVCHYSLECRRFETGCAHCPAVRPFARTSVEASLRRKVSLPYLLDTLHVVAPSRWLAEEAAKSAVFRGRAVEVIPNPLPSDFPAPLDTLVARNRHGIADGSTVFLIGAAELSDPVKATRSAIEAFIQVARDHSDAVLLLAGRGQPRIDHPQIRALGYLNQAAMVEALSATDYLVVPSRAENQPLSIAEAQALGVSLIARNATGLPEHLDIDPEGSLFDSDTDLTEKLVLAVSNGPRLRTRAELAERARDKFNPATAVDSYLNIYQ